MLKKLVTIGGGRIKGWNFDTKDSNQEIYETENIDKEIVKLSEKENPKLLFIGTASRENSIYFNAIKNIYEDLGCVAESLEIISSNDLEKIREKVLSSDIVYIGGGNTRFMLQEWERVGLKEILLEAYNNGIVMSGFSAGAYCWFKYNYELIEGFNLINAVVCVHYDEKSEEKKKQFYEVIKNNNMMGIALDNGTALEVINNRFKVIKSIENAKAYIIKYVNGDIKVETIESGRMYDII